MRSLTQFFHAFQRGAGVLHRLEFWLIAGMVGGSVISERLYPAAVGAGVILLIIRFIASPAPFRLKRLDIFILGLCFLQPVTLAVTALPERTIPQVYRLFTGILLAYAIAHWGNSRARLGMLTAGFCALGLGLSAVAIFSVQWSYDKFDFLHLDFLKTLTTLKLDQVQPNILAGVLVLVFVFTGCGMLFY